ncbi:MAG: response regulator [Archangiaceae bacterium]|nr:response regulator [Archangiaceae bacterium]
MSTEHRKTILVVEDERIVAMDLQRTLQGMGYEVPITAASADDAFRYATERCPDLVLMDIHIKGERDGIEAAQLLRERFAVPVIFLTAYSDHETLSRAAKTEPHGYLCKPVKNDVLRSSIEVALYKHEVDKRVRERERWFSTTLRSIGDAVVSVDVGGKVTFMNAAAERLTGWAEAEAQGRPVAQVLQLLDERTGVPLADPFSRALERGERIEVSGALGARGGPQRLVSDSTAPVLSPDGRATGAVMVFRDVTDQRRLRQQLEQAERLKALGTLSAGMAHELNNPLAVMLSNTRWVTEELQRRATQEVAGLGEVLDSLKDILEAGQRAAKIIADLKTFSRAEGADQRSSLQRCIESSLRFVEPELNLRARVHLELEAMGDVAADETRLGQLLVNVLLNAAQAFEPARFESNRLTVKAVSDGKVAHVSISDTGRGMSAEVAARAFEPFFTTRRVGAGTGLGLSICHGIARSVGGDLRLESALGRGTTVFLDLPLYVEKPAPAPLPARSGKKPSLLIIDDEPLVRSAVRRMLGPRFEVTLAESATQALAQLVDGARYDVVLTDVRMPDMTVLELHQALLERVPEQAARLAFMTGGVGEPDVLDALSALPNLVLDKTDLARLGDALLRVARGSP